MYKIAITVRKKNDMTFFMNNTYYQFLSSFFDIELVLPRNHHNYIDIVNRNDALLICGGDDIDPQYFNQTQHIQTLKEFTDIETMDFDLFQQFYDKEKPIIGICRGIQVINVILGGDLYQDVPSQYLTQINHSCKCHTVIPNKDTFFFKYFSQPLKVNSFHHQSIKNITPTIKVNAVSEDGLIEGIESNQVLAVQWHPERMDKHHQELFINMIINFIENNKTNKKEPF